MCHEKGVIILTENTNATASQAVCRIKVAQTAKRPNPRSNIRGEVYERIVLNEMRIPCFKTRITSTKLTV